MQPLSEDTTRSGTLFTNSLLVPVLPSRELHGLRPAAKTARRNGRLSVIVSVCIFLGPGASRALGHACVMLRHAVELVMEFVMEWLVSTTPVDDVGLGAFPRATVPIFELLYQQWINGVAPDAVCRSW